MRIRSHQLNIAAAWLLSCGFKLLFATLRIRFFCVDEAARPYSQADGQFFIYPIWHDSMAAPIFGGRQSSMVALVGTHTDGTYVSTILQSVGIGSVRGSSSRGGSQALRQLVADTRDLHLVLTPDGPRGPRRQLKPGLAFMASRTGKPIIPTAFASRHAWYLQGRWTDLMIPKPFSTLYGLAGEPIRVPPKASKEELERFTCQIQSAMDRLDELVRQVVSGQLDGETAIALAASSSAAEPADNTERIAA
ncbi:DUF374 domain-containing protein [bacterium]|nr:DUF374 domain-containing protein [bacterium]